jgi:hypothetical protein
VVADRSVAWPRVACSQYVCPSYSPIILHTSLIASFRDDLDVMIKFISYKEDGASELEILKYLSSEPVKSDPDNPALPLLDFLCHDDLKFAVQPRWSSCVEPEFFNISDGLNFCIQVTKVMDFTQTCFTRDTHCPTGCRIFAPPPHRSFGYILHHVVCLAYEH